MISRLVNLKIYLTILFLLQNDLLLLFQPFGVITKLVVLRSKNQALLQMQNIPSAIRAVEFFANAQPSISLDELQQ